jgi:alkylation response protein AidB-like acyl-CoA dehydrogenase
MAARLVAARATVHTAARALDAGDPRAPALCAMAKQVATDDGFDIVNDALQLHGGYGYLTDYEIERYFRDVRVHQILEGTNEIMSVIVARALLAEE